MHDMSPMLPPFGWDALLHTWQFRPGWTLVAVLLLGGYLAALVRCQGAGGRPVPAWRVGCFVTGVVLWVLTASSAIDVYAMAAFWVHMVEHLLWIMVVPALLVLGHPLTLARAASAPRDGRGGTVDRLLGSWPVTLLTHPLVGLGLYAAVIVGTHLTSFMDAMVVHPWLMDGEQALYVVTGYLFLLPLVGDEPIRWRLPHLGRLLLLLIGMTPDTVVGIVLMQATHDLFPRMEGMHPGWAPRPLDDLATGGALMWVGGDGLMMLMGVGVIIAMIRTPGRSQVLGARLEGVRRHTMATHVADGEGSFDGETDVDDDEEMLAAYNRMLGRLQQRE